MDSPSLQSAADVQIYSFCEVDPMKITNYQIAEFEGMHLTQTRQLLQLKTPIHK